MTLFVIRLWRKCHGDSQGLRQLFRRRVPLQQAGFRCSGLWEDRFAVPASARWSRGHGFLQGEVSGLGTMGLRAVFSLDWEIMSLSIELWAQVSIVPGPSRDPGARLCCRAAGDADNGQQKLLMVTNDQRYRYCISECRNGALGPFPEGFPSLTGARGCFPPRRSGSGAGTRPGPPVTAVTVCAGQKHGLLGMWEQ